MGFQRPEYPKILTDAEWQKQNSIIAKLTGETGIGAAIKKCQEAYSAIKWGILDPRRGEDGVKRPSSDAALEACLKAAKTQIATSVENCRTALRNLSSLADNVAKKWKDSKTIPKASREHVEKISKDSLNFATTLKSLDYQEPFTQLGKEIAEHSKKVKAAIDIWVKSIMAGLQKCVTNPTQKEYEDSLHQKVRGMDSALSTLKEYATLHPPWKTMAADGFVIRNDACKDATALKGQLVKIAAELKKVQAAMT